MRVLMITVARMDKGGIESYLMSLVRNFDHMDIHVDFVVHRQEIGCYENEIKKWGSTIYKLPRLSQHPLKYVHKLYSVIKNGNYDIVHRHATASVMWIDLAIAKWAGTKIRIAHSHSTSWTHKTLHKFLRFYLNHYATDHFACSSKAGKWMYGNTPFVVMKNGINVDRFRFKKNIRDEYRKNFGWNNKKVVLHVARFTEEKNHNWIIDLISKIKDVDVLFCFVGDGPLRKLIEQKAENERVAEKTVFLGQRDDVGNIMMASDCFILPSLFEGLPVTVIEAQCTGLNCIVSTNVTKEVDLGMVTILPLIQEEWIKELNAFDWIAQDRERGYYKVLENGYSDKQSSDVMCDYYKKKLQGI